MSVKRMYLTTVPVKINAVAMPSVARLERFLGSNFKESVNNDFITGKFVSLKSRPKVLMATDK